MKRYLPPVLLFLLVFLTSLWCMHYTLQFQEGEGLFLLAPDYFRSVFSHPFPLSRVVNDFQTQFYRLDLCGPLILAVEAVAAYFLVKGILSRFGVLADWVCLAAVAVVWYFTARSETTVPLVAVLLILVPLWLLSRLFHSGKTIRVPGDVVPAVVVTGVAAALVVLSPSIRHAEKWARVRNALTYQKWEALGEYVTPAKVAKDHELLPFVALALGESGQLGDRLFTYPVYGENDFDMCDEQDYYNSLFFRSALYRQLGCTNESIHNLFQLTVLQKHGTGFHVLRQLVQEYYKAGDYDMVEKYCKVLDRSTLHGKYTRYFRQLAAEGKPAEDTGTEERAGMPVITRQPLQNLFLLQSRGMSAPSVLDRLLTTLLLQRKVDRFAELLEANRDRYQTIPQHYQEALAVYFQEYGVPVFMYPVLPDPPVLGRFRRFNQLMDASADIKSQQEAYGNTYWFYYYYTE